MDDGLDMDNVIDLGGRLARHKIEMWVYPAQWEPLGDHLIGLLQNGTMVKWKEIKFLNDDASDFSNEIDNLPSNHGGVYIFTIRLKPIPTLTNYLVYVGRARRTQFQNLRKRCRSYFTEYRTGRLRRDRIYRMLEYWGSHLYLQYCELDDNTMIDNLENELIKAILPPFNSDIPNVTVRAARNAF